MEQSLDFGFGNSLEHHDRFGDIYFGHESIIPEVGGTRGRGFGMMGLGCKSGGM